MIDLLKNLARVAVSRYPPSDLLKNLARVAVSRSDPPSAERNIDLNAL